MPDSFIDREAGADASRVGAFQPMEFASLPTVSGDAAFSLLGIAPGPGLSRIVAFRRLAGDGSGHDRDEYAVYDPVDNSVASLLIISPLFSAAISRDLGAAAWIAECLGYVQTLEFDVMATLLNQALRDTTCLRPPLMSADGSTAVFDAARGHITDTGELVFAGFDGRLHGPVVHGLVSGTTQSLASTDIVLDDPELQRALPIHYRANIADNGNLVAVRTAFVPDDQVQGSINEVIDNGSLVTTGDGHRVAYLTEGRAVLLDLEHGERVTFVRAIRACTDVACEFDSYRFVSNAPLRFSAAGSRLLISAVLERGSIDNPQIAQEVMVLDIGRRTLRRLAPGIDIDRAAVSDDGTLFVFDTDEGGLIVNDDDFDTSLFLVRDAR